MTRPLAPIRGSTNSARSAVPDPTSSARPPRVTGYIGGGNLLPTVMESKTQQRVVEVVDARNGGEHPLNGLFAGLARPGRDGDRSR